MPEHGLEHGAHGADHGDKTPAFIAAVLSVLLALVSLGSHREHTRAVLMQAKASDAWAYYQATRIKLHLQETAADILASKSQASGEDGEEIADLPAGYAEKIKDYKEKSKEREAEARELEEKVHHAENKANYFDIGEIFLEVGIVLSSLTFLTRRNIFWKIAAVSGAVGIVIAALSFTVH